LTRGHIARVGIPLAKQAKDHRPDMETVLTSAIFAGFTVVTNRPTEA